MKLKFYKTTKTFLSAVICCVLPALVWSDQIETQISADIINVRKDKILYAEGNVLRVQHGDKQIRAKAL